MQQYEGASSWHGRQRHFLSRAGDNSKVFESFDLSNERIIYAKNHVIYAFFG